MFYLFLIYLFIICGIVYILFDKDIPEFYIVITLFFLFKFLFNYRKCTLSYYECQLRGVEKEYGYLYNFMENILNYRDTYHIYLIYIISLYIIYYYFVIKKNRIYI